MIDVVAIGAGWVTNNRHIPAVRRSRLGRVVGVVDQNPERAAAVARHHRLPYSGTDLGSSWVASAQAFTVGVSPAAHYNVAAQLLEAGKPVLLEKPMSLTVAEGERLAELAAARDVAFAVVHNFQFARSVLAVRRWLGTGQWGRVTGLQGFQWSNPARRLPTWYETLPLGLFYDESPHLLYLLRTFGGPLTLRRAAVVPSATGSVTPQQVTAEFSAGGIPSTLVMNFEAPVSEWQLVVMAEGGMALIDLFRDIAIYLPNDRRHAARHIARTSAGLVAGHLRGFISSGLRLVAGKQEYGNDEVMVRFLTAAMGGKPVQGIAPEDGLDVLKAQHAILAAVNG